MRTFSDLLDAVNDVYALDTKFSRWLVFPYDVYRPYAGCYPNHDTSWVSVWLSQRRIVSLDCCHHGELIAMCRTPKCGLQSGISYEEIDEVAIHPCPKGWAAEAIIDVLGTWYLDIEITPDSDTLPWIKPMEAFARYYLWYENTPWTDPLRRNILVEKKKKEKKKEKAKSRGSYAERSTAAKQARTTFSRRQELPFLSFVESIDTLLSDDAEWSGSLTKLRIELAEITCRPPEGTKETRKLLTSFSKELLEKNIRVRWTKTPKRSRPCIYRVPPMEEVSDSKAHKEMKPKDPTALRSFLSTSTTPSEFGHIPTQEFRSRFNAFCSARKMKPWKKELIDEGVCAFPNVSIIRPNNADVFKGLKWKY